MIVVAYNPTREYDSLMGAHGFLSVKLKMSLSAGTRHHQISSPAHKDKFPSLSMVTGRINSMKYITNSAFLTVIL